MAVGIPGTGLGGVFYFSMALMMPARQFARWWLGQEEPGQWRSVARHLALLGGILAVMALEAIVIRDALDLILRLAPADSTLAVATQEAVHRVAPGLALIPFVIIGAILGGLELLRMEVTWWETVRRRAQQPPLPA